MADRPPEREADLVRACADGDGAAWERFVAGYAPLLASLARRMLLRRTGRAADADVDEIGACVFLALLKGERRLLRRYRSEFRLSTYLGVICRTEVGRYLRHPDRRQRAFGAGGDDGDRATPPDPADPHAESPLGALERRERDEAVLGLRAALAELPERDRLLLSMRYLDGLDYGAIADALRIRRDSVGQLLHRAKERLAQHVPDLSRWVEGGTEAP